jgi:hypothetical protein
MEQMRNEEKGRERKRMGGGAFPPSLPPRFCFFLMLKFYLKKISIIKPL